MACPFVPSRHLSESTLNPSSRKGPTQYDSDWMEMSHGETFMIGKPYHPHHPHLPPPRSIFGHVLFQTSGADSGGCGTIAERAGLTRVISGYCTRSMTCPWSLRQLASGILLLKYFGDVMVGDVCWRDPYCWMRRTRMSGRFEMRERERIPKGQNLAYSD